jgi:hypothetical protein
MINKGPHRGIAGPSPSASEAFEEAAREDERTQNARGMRIANDSSLFWMGFLDPCA